MQIAALFLLVSLLLQGISYIQSDTMDSVRSYVRGEGLWAKAQKDAVYHLLDYIQSKNPEEYNKFLQALEVPLGDSQARILLQSDQLDRAKAHTFFLQGQNHPEDIPGMIRFFRRFEHFPYMSEAIAIWARADEKIHQLIELGEQIKVVNEKNDTHQLKAFLKDLESLNGQLTSLEYNFSFVLSEGARWVKQVLMWVSFAMLVLMLIPVVFISRKIIAGIENTERKLLLSENRFKALYQTDMLGILDWHGDGRILDANDTFLNMLGYKPRDLEQGFLNWRKLTPEDGYKRDDKALAEIAEKGYCKPYEKEFLSATGNRISVYLGAALFDGEQKRGIAFVIDHTEQMITQTELKLSAAVFNASSDGILITDEHLNVITVNRAFCDLMGYSADELVGHSADALKSGLMPENFYQQLWQDLKQTGSWQGDVIDRKSNDESIPVRLSINAVSDANGHISHYVAIFTDISERKATEDQLRKLAHYDFLTGLANRSLFNELLSSAMSRAKRTKRIFAVLFIDLDRFKPVNDRFGHEVGDKLLCKIAARLKKTMRDQDVVARLGGDEFVVMIEDLATAEAASQVAENIIESVNRSCDIDDYKLNVGCSIGISIFPDNGETVLDILNAADVAMYAAKASGRNQYYYFNLKNSK